MVTLEITEKEVRILHALVRFENERVSEIVDQLDEVSPEDAEYADDCAYLVRGLETKIKHM